VTRSTGSPICCHRSMPPRRCARLVRCFRTCTRLDVSVARDHSHKQTMMPTLYYRRRGSHPSSPVRARTVRSRLGLREWPLSPASDTRGGEPVTLAGTAWNPAQRPFPILWACCSQSFHAPAYSSTGLIPRNLISSTVSVISSRTKASSSSGEPSAASTPILAMISL
jgi:hypothetical protein